MGARPLQDLEHARVERAREHSLHVGHDRAGGRDDGFDGTCGDRRRADARTRERGTNPPGQRRENHGNEHGRDDDFQHAPQALLRFDTRGKRTIHAAVMTKGRAVLASSFNDLRVEIRPSRSTSHEAVFRSGQSLRLGCASLRAGASARLTLPQGSRPACHERANGARESNGEPANPRTANPRQELSS